MKAIIVLIFSPLLITSCNKNEASRIPNDKDIVATQTLVQENSQLKFYILAKVSSSRLQEIRQEITQFNHDIGLEFLNMSSILIGDTKKEPYLLLRGFADQNHALAYKEEILQLPVRQELENIIVLTQDNYREFVMENSSRK